MLEFFNNVDTASENKYGCSGYYSKKISISQEKSQICFVLASLLKFFDCFCVWESLILAKSLHWIKHEVLSLLNSLSCFSSIKSLKLFAYPWNKLNLISKNWSLKSWTIVYTAFLFLGETHWNKFFVIIILLGGTLGETQKKKSLK